MPSRFSKDALSPRLKWSAINPRYLDQLIAQARSEDLSGLGLRTAPRHALDVSSTLFSDRFKIGKRALLVAREACILCGLELVPRILKAYDPKLSFRPNAQDGDSLEKGGLIGQIEGPATPLLQAERILLNFLQHLSGIATATRHYSDCLEGSETRLLDTRKTLPLYRVLEKYAFVCGGGYNHRYGLYDRIMIKDNHWAALASETDAHALESLNQLRQDYPELPMHIEVDRCDQIERALEAGADCILLDNFSPEALKQALALIDNRAYTEASGGIQREDLDTLKQLGLDFISTGAPVHQSRWIDLGLDCL